MNESDVREEVRDEYIGDIAVEDSSTVIVQFHRVGWTVEMTHKEFLRSDYIRKDGKVFERKERMICTYCRRKPMYDDNNDEYFCPIC